MINRNPVDREARILILGAGPGGLSAAHFLSRHGFKNVTVFEKLGRVGGMCRSVTEDNQSFDLGAIFVSSAYREVLRMARCVGAELERFEGATAFVYDETSQSARYHGLLPYVMGGSSLSAFCRFAGLCLRYLRKRYRIRKIFRRPGWAGIDAHPALCVTFAEWLDHNGLEDLNRLFEIPVTTFGYGFLDEIPAPYVLRYMGIRTFLAMLFSSAPFARLLPSFLVAQRFRYGFQRFWERVAWDLNIRLNVDVKKIERREEGIFVKYTHPMQMLGDEVSHAEKHARFDYLIVACPLLLEELESFLDLTEEERWFQSKTRFIPYAVASFEIADLVLPMPVAFHLPLPSFDQPMIIAQQHRENELMTFYARLASSEPTPADELQLRENIERYIGALGGRINEQDDWNSYDAWLYFKHVGVEEFRRHYFDRWEEAQGKNRTFFVGGLFDFDYVEGIVRYSRYLVEQHFAGRAGS